MQHRILTKIRKAGGISKEKAVTVDDANFDLQELQWLDYFTGTFRGGIKRTKDNRYYL
ncbi:MAG: hypothetical protein JSV58_03810 [Candidatus Bathyarchaeota archaeon]|nr:MAG: hypothetical protein JSV58_03810 [Candidatus Bathyarchaeota archaeon]